MGSTVLRGRACALPFFYLKGAAMLGQMISDLPRSPVFKQQPIPDWAMEALAFDAPPPTDDEAQARGLGPEAGTGQVAGGPAGNVITMNVTGTALAGVITRDQAWFFSLNADVPVDATYAIATVDVDTEDNAWTPAQVSLFLGLEPLFLVCANITAASAAAVMAGMRLGIRRSDPFGSVAGSQQPQTAYQNAADFQTTRGQFPIAEAIDAWTWARLISPAQVAAATYTVAWFFGPRQDRRAQVPRIQPQIVRNINK